MRKSLIRILTTDYKKVHIYGDIVLHLNGWITPFIGMEIRVKILWLFWTKYKRSYFKIKNPDELTKKRNRRNLKINKILKDG